MSAPVHEHPYARFIHEVRRPAQYLGGESGEIQKDWDAAAGRMCLAFPDLYEVGMSHLGFKILYGVLNGHERLLAERAYAPARDMEAVLRREDERLRSLESWRPLSDFDVVGFSLQFELTYSNVLTMLDLGGIPLRTADRGEDDPLIVAGGPVATHPEPIAPFLDCLVIGDGEERTPELVLAWSQMTRAGVPRAERLRAIAQLEGVYVPSLYDVARDPETGFVVVTGPRAEEAPYPVERTFIESLDDHPFPTEGPVAVTETVFDRVSVEIARGCTEGCRFCQAGMIYRPVRERAPAQILDVIESAVRDHGYDEASLTSLSTADYSAITPLVREVVERLDGKRVSLGVSSLRAYGLSGDILDEMKKGRAGGLTFAPEAGTQRMRDVVNKNVTEAQLMQTAENVFSRGWSKMKLYFMIGLPTEEEEDVRGIVQTGQRALDVGRGLQGRHHPRVTVSVSTHVPKPHTPFQWCAMDAYETVREKQGWLRDEQRRSGVKLRMHDSKGSWLEGVLARGDRTLADVIEGAWRRGARFDSWEEELRLEAWEEAFDEHGIDTSIFLGTIPVTARLPWDHFDLGLEEGFLAREYRKAMRNRLSPPCGKVAGMFVHHTNVEEAEADQKKLVCYDCGIACDMDAMREERLVKLTGLGAIDKPEARPPSAPISPKERQKAVSPDQGPFVRVRLSYTRLGRLAFSSHLDMVRLMPRLFRRARLPLYYSQGYSPKPLMTFGPSLRLGVASLAELMDLKLRGDGIDGELDPEDLIARLGEASLEGLTFERATVLGDNDPSLSKLVDEIEYVAGLSRDALATLGVSDEAGLRALFASRRDGELVVRRTVKGIGKKVDVGHFLLGVSVGDEAEALKSAGIVGELLPVRMTIASGPAGTARPTEVLEALGGVAELSARYVRTRLGCRIAGEVLSPHDLEAIRAARARARETAAA